MKNSQHTSLELRFPIRRLLSNLQIGLKEWEDYKWDRNTSGVRDQVWAVGWRQECLPRQECYCSRSYL